MKYDENEKCVKCGFDRIQDEFKAAGSLEPIIAIGITASYIRRTTEAIERTCLRCKYTWEEEPLDT